MSPSQTSDSWFGIADEATAVARRTNPLAVASLVLGVVWCGGIGSLAAVILAVQARRSIRRSNGTETGEGLAIAGLVLGIVGLVGAVLTTLLIVAVGITANSAVHSAIQRFGNQRVVVQAGRPVTITTSDFATGSGIKTATVFAVVHPVPALNESDTPGTGKEIAVADIQVCAGPTGSQDGPMAALFNLVFPGGAQVSPSGTAVKQPNLLDIRGMGPRQCTRGYATYEIATGTRPSSVTYQPGPLRIDRK